MLLRRQKRRGTILNSDNIQQIAFHLRFTMFLTYTEGLFIGVNGVVGAYWKRSGRLGGNLGRRGGVLGAFWGRHDATNSVLRAS